MSLTVKKYDNGFQATFIFIREIPGEQEILHANVCNYLKAQQGLIEGEKRIAKAEAKIAEGNAKIAEGEAKIAQAQQMRADDLKKKLSQLDGIIGILERKRIVSIPKFSRADNEKYACLVEGAITDCKNTKANLERNETRSAAIQAFKTTQPQIFALIGNIDALCDIGILKNKKIFSLAKLSDEEKKKYAPLLEKAIAELQIIRTNFESIEPSALEEFKAKHREVTELVGNIDKSVANSGTLVDAFNRLQISRGK